MPELNVYTLIIALSALIILSYVFTLINRKTRIPTVFMLLLLGISIREIMKYTGHYIALPLDVIQLFGVLGLILILLEAGLDLKLSRSKLHLMKNAAAASVFVLFLSTAGIAAVVHYLLHQSWLVSAIYAVPLAVISSTVVASSIHHLGEDKREFLTYESSFSDIIGILLFNFLIAGQIFNLGLLSLTILNIAIAILLSTIISILLIWLLTKAQVNIKAFLIFAVLMLIYSLGHLFNLPTLLTILMFGLIINNWPKIQAHLSWLPLSRIIPIQDVNNVTEVAKSVTQESAFLIRTFFFTLFGYTVELHSLTDSTVLLVGTLVVTVIFVVRYLYLQIFLQHHILPELFFAPRGLVTIVLFYSIPTVFKFDDFDSGILFYVIMVTTLIMMAGSLWFTPEEATREAEDQINSESESALTQTNSQ